MGRVSVPFFVAIMVVGVVAFAPPVAGVTPPVGSAKGDAWSDTIPASGTAVLTFGHVGCSNVNAEGDCIGGSWPHVPGGSWIWKTKLVTPEEALGGTLPTTFTKTMTGPACSPGKLTATIKVAADDHAEVSFNGELVGVADELQIHTFTTPGLTGVNTIEATVTGEAYTSDDPTQNPAGVAYAVTFTCAITMASSGMLVVGGAGYQGRPSGNDDYVVWTDYRKNKSIPWAQQWTLFVRAYGSSRKVQINAAGTGGDAGRLVPGTNLVVYQQFTSHNSGIFFYDLGTHRRWEIPALHSSKWDHYPVASERYVLFERWTQDANTVWLYDLTTKKVRQIASATTHSDQYFQVKSVGSRYATWERYQDKRYWSYLYDIRRKTTRRIPQPTGVSQWGPVVDEISGVVYFVRVRSCVNTQIVRQPLSLSGAAQVVFQQPADTVPQEIFLQPREASGRFDLLGSWWFCSHETEDIYTLKGVGAMTGDLAEPRRARVSYPRDGGGLFPEHARVVVDRPRGEMLR